MARRLRAIWHKRSAAPLRPRQLTRARLAAVTHAPSQATLTELQAKLPTLDAANWELVAASADLEGAATAFAATLGLTFPVIYGLTEPDLASLGVYVSYPNLYIPQSHAFSEPAYFVLDPDGTVRYIEKGSFPAGGRPNVDNILAACAFDQSHLINYASLELSSCAPQLAGPRRTRRSTQSSRRVGWGVALSSKSFSSF